jgi:hypothetical protein
MRLVPKPLGFTYRMTYVPKGARNPRPGLFRGAGSAAVRHIEPDEARQAFRVKWPKTDTWQCTRNACSLDLLHYAGELWWPYLDYDSVNGFAKKTHSAADCLEDIKTCPYLFERPEIDGSYDVSEEVPLIRTRVETDHDEKLALSQRKTYENFLICGNRAYVRGGMPVFFRNSYYRKRTWEIEIASIGSDRRGDPATNGLYDPPGSFQDRLTEQAFGSGAFWLPNEFAAAKSAAHPEQSKFPRIEIFMPELVTDLRQQIRLDSLFREVVRMFRHPFHRHWLSGPVWSFKEEFAKLCDPVLDDRELSRQRLDLLRAFVVEIDEVGFWDMDRIRLDIVSFVKQEQCDPTWPQSLAIDDIDALNLLAG